jgi:lysyl endopeptidase
MNKLFYLFILSILSAAPLHLFGAEWSPVSKEVPTFFIGAPNLEEIKKEDQINDKQGKLYRIGVSTYTHITSSNSGRWTTLPTGEQMWQLIVKNPNAEALSFIFHSFSLSPNSIFFVQNKQGQQVSETITKADQMEDLQQHIALCFGDELVLTLIEPTNEPNSEFVLSRVIYNYRSTGNPSYQKINESDDCEVNINCTEGANYLDEKKGVARIYVVGSDGAGWCSGSVVNNLANDCKPYMLTALHCGPAVNTSAANMNLWKFYFQYEAPTCTNPTSVGSLASKFISGCFRIADSNDNNGTDISKSDFLLVQMGTLLNEEVTIGKLITFNAYWNGWDAGGSTTTGGVGIHHPAGDIKKISTFNGTTVSSTWASVSGTHWRVSWSSTANGHGVTEGGSSGSPLFAYNGGASRIIGTLSGGSSYCTSPTNPDLYGKVSYHWQSAGSLNNQRLKPWLDPSNSGTMVQNGSYNPCSFIGLKEQENKKNGIRMYPNPTAGVLFVDLTTQQGTVILEIYDLMGKLVASTNTTAGLIFEWPLSDLSEGLYQVVVLGKKGRSMQRISKQ